ncbi:hypothetical protein [Dactylosporangium salmoneum]|uniref:Uncharacterized protein n=1 Tax=Dactylosporangium salmoneum TaxID=53361 RepID=A0ABP5SAZ9_9ACTN
MLTYNHHKADNALRLLQLAHDQWTYGLKAIQGSKYTEELRDRALRQYGYAFTMLLLARGLDDMCKTTASYTATRARMVDLLEATRYAANHTVHQLSAVGQPIGVITWPLQWPIEYTVGHMEWVPEGHLPAASDEKDDAQRRFRARYLELLAGRDMSPALAQLRWWFEEQVLALGS